MTRLDTHPTSPPGNDGVAPRPRSLLRVVAVPTEHGGWSLTIEPVLIGLLVAWSWSGLLLGFCALLAFVARTPVKVVLVDVWRGRRRKRTALAARVAAAELTVMAGLAVLATTTASHRFWLPLLTAAPLLAVELWFDMRSRSRRLLPELIGTIGIGSVGAAIVLAATGDARPAAAVWCIVAARAVAAIPYVRIQLQRGHGHRPARWHSDVAQFIAVAMIATALALDLVPALPAVAIGLIAIMNLAGVRRRVRPASIIGIQQMCIGLGVAVVAAVSLPSP